MFFINGIILTIASIIIRFAGLSFNVYISNMTSPEAVGIFSLVMSVYFFFITVATSGLSMATTCIVSEEFAKGNKELAIKTVRTCILFSFLLGIIAMVIICLCSNLLSSICLGNRISNKVFYFIAIGLPFIAMSSCINGYFTAIRKSYKTAISQIFELMIKIIATILLLKFNINNGIEAICISLILGDVIAEICSFTLCFVLYLKDNIIAQKGLKYFFSISNSRKIFKSSYPVALTSYIRSGLTTLTQLIIPIRLEKSGLSATLALSQYGIIQGMVMPILLFPNVLISSFCGLLIPEFSTYLAKGYKKSIRNSCKKILIISCIFSFLIASIFFFFSNELSLLIYKNIESSLYIKLLSPLVFFIYIDNIIDAILKGLNKQFEVMCCNVVDLAITIGFIYFLVPIFGIYGFIASIYISELFNFAVSSYQLSSSLS